MKLYNKSSHGQPNPAMPLDHTAWCKSTVWDWWTSSKEGSCNPEHEVPGRSRWES